MYRIIFLLSLSILFVACSTTDSSPGAVLSTDVTISYVTEDGTDLVNPEQTNAIGDQNTELYYLQNGETTEYFESNLDNPNGISVIEPNRLPSDHYGLKILANTIPGQNQATTYIRFSDGTQDTLKAEYENNGNSDVNGTVITKVWYNQEIRWSTEEESERFFTITKPNR